LTVRGDHNTITQDQLKLGGVIVTGTIRCNKCRKKMDGVCECGGYKCFVQIYWKKKYYEFRRDDQGYVFTYDKAIDRLIEINGKIKNRTFSPDEFSDAKIHERKFENQIEKWLDEKEKRTELNELSPGTLKDYAGYVKNHYSLFNEYDVREIGLAELTEFKDTLSGVSIKTRKNIMNGLNNFFNWLRERGVITERPLFPKITGDDSKPRVAIDWETQDEVLKRIPEQHRGIIEFMNETGLRPGEVCALLCEHIHLNEKEAKIGRTYVSGNKIRETTKQKRKGEITLSERALEIAKKHIQGKLPKQFLFINLNTNKGYLAKVLWYQFHMYSGLENITLHEGTRHSFGTQLIEDNDMYKVKEAMRHSDIRMTEKYLHLKVAKLADMVNSRKKPVKLLNRSDIEVRNER
jgi:integrase